LGQEKNIQSEREVLKSIDHPFLMNLRYAFQSESKLYFVMDYYRGGDLNQHLQRRGRYREVEVKFIAAQIALAIGCLHSHGIVYRDLKPENILLDDIGNCCLCDFGLCKKLTDAASDGIIDCDYADSRKKPKSKRKRLKSTQTPCGTPDYVAPEVIKGLPYDQNVDWWSFGILVFELTVGSVPFFSLSNAEMFQKITSAPVRFPTWIVQGDPDCQQFIESLLERTVNQRLGYEHDIDDVKGHLWFDTIDWDRVLQKKIDPPYHPNVDLSNEMKTVAQNVAPRYQRMDARDSIAKTPDIDGGANFESFTYNGCSDQSTGHRLLDGGSISVNESAKNGKRNLYPITHILNNLSTFDGRLDAELMGQLQVLEDENESEEADDEEDID